MESNAKVTKICDQCKSVMSDKDGDKSNFIEATLNNAKGENQAYSFDSEECLRLFLNGRAKKKQSKAGFDFDFRVKPRKST